MQKTEYYAMMQIPIDTHNLYVALLAQHNINAKKFPVNLKSPNP
jgi:hypothetical protein